MSEEFYKNENPDGGMNEKREMMDEIDEHKESSNADSSESYDADASYEAEKDSYEEEKRSHEEEKDSYKEGNGSYGQENHSYGEEVSGKSEEDSLGTDGHQENMDKGSGTASSYSFWAEQVAAASAGNVSGTDSQDAVHAGSTNFSSDTNDTPFGGAANQGAQGYSYGAAAPVYDIPAKKKKSRRGFRFLKKAVKFIAIAASFGIIAGAAFLGFNACFYNLNPDAAPIAINFGNGFLSFGKGVEMEPSYTPIAATTVTNNTIQQKTDLTNVVDETMPSIVTITSVFNQSYNWFGQEMDQENEGGGSGIIVGENDKELLIATNNHVVADAKSITVNFIDNTKAKATVKGTDSIADLAVISIKKSELSEKTLNEIKIAKLGDSKSVKVGQMAIAIGNALGYGQSVTVGYISAKDREVTVDDNKMVLLQTDAAINPGNSGGALLNLNGEVIGINSVKYASSEVEGMGYAIPISRAIPIINELMKREVLQDNEKGYLGVYISDVTQDAADMYHWPMGVYVTEVIDGGSAQKAGIVAGDIITGVNDTEITSGKQLQEKVTSYRVGTEVKITLKRSENGEFKEKQITVTLGQNPKSDGTKE